MHISEKIVHTSIGGIPFRFCNQSSEDWTYPYPYEGSDDDLCSSGCGIFSVVHASQWMTGRFFPPELLARFALEYGGRGDDGTDRPTLLRTMEKHGLSHKMGFTYHGEDLRNDLDELYAHLSEGKGCALCNLRVGHIVALLGAKEVDGVRQVLVVDSASETDNPLIRNAICQIDESTAISKEKRNAAHLLCAYAKTYAVYWAKLDIVRDFNLLHALV